MKIRLQFVGGSANDPLFVEVRNSLRPGDFLAAESYGTCEVIGVTPASDSPDQHAVALIQMSVPSDQSDGLLV